MPMATQFRFLPNHHHPFTSSTSRRSSPVNFVVKIRSQIQSSQLQALSKKNRRPENVDGDFFVDHTCIDCDTCRWMAPEIFTRVGDMSAVSKQPSCQDERVKALQALLSCPTSSISTEKPARDILEVQKTFPIPIDIDRIPVILLIYYFHRPSLYCISIKLHHQLFIGYKILFDHLPNPFVLSLLIY
ncbi:hypothetical protein HanIR_Chr03g0101611 [Helianthus annuus]|nr:hypothetical protein HanIR_Chr03g0101611 [Helianthus annuus]